MSKDKISEIEKERHRVILDQRMNRFVYVDLFRSKDGFLPKKGYILFIFRSNFTVCYRCDELKERSTREIIILDLFGFAAQ